MDNIEFGKYLSNLRKNRSLTVNQLAVYSGVSAALISRVENGKRGIPKPETLSKLAEVLNVPTAQLLSAAGYFDGASDLARSVLEDKNQLTQFALNVEQEWKDLATNEPEEFLSVLTDINGILEHEGEQPIASAHDLIEFFFKHLTDSQKFIFVSKLLSGAKRQSTQDALEEGMLDLLEYEKIPYSIAGTEPKLKFQKKSGAKQGNASDVSKNSSTRNNISHEEHEFLEWVKNNLEGSFFYDFSKSREEQKSEMMRGLRLVWELEKGRKPGQKQGE